jgi:hypothetical protein
MIVAAEPPAVSQRLPISVDAAALLVKASRKIVASSSEDTRAFWAVTCSPV